MVFESIAEISVGRNREMFISARIFDSNLKVNAKDGHPLFFIFFILFFFGGREMDEAVWRELQREWV